MGRALGLAFLLPTLLAFAPRAWASADCAALRRLVPPGSGAVFLPSYPTSSQPALRGVAFAYDNALAVMALLACGDRGDAARVGAALRAASARDRYWHDGRVRNAYRAGEVAADRSPALPGWWDVAAKRWDEDLYQVGTATGNVAWAALALIALNPVHPDPAAARMVRFVAETLAVSAPVPGYAGGFFGEEPLPTRQGWESTEQNADAAAAFRQLGMREAEAVARGFVAAMWDEKPGRFATGTDAVRVTYSGTGLDAQVFPLLAFPHATVEWGRALSYAAAHFAVGGGVGFSEFSGAMWTEGTAQLALALAGRDERRRAALLRVVEAQRAPDGLLYATPAVEMRTGLAVAPGSKTDDFRYYHLPHLGATSWAVLAAARVDPFAPR
jgi:hypothetical protein